jgi:hypothetical protein
MFVRRIGLAALLVCGALSACDALAADDGRATVRQIMLGIVIPASDGVFEVRSKAPQNDTEWDLVEADAMVLAEAGRLLIQDDRTVDQGQWVADAKRFTKAALTVAEYARKRDIDKVIDAGDGLYDACDACHTTYNPVRVGP